MANTSRETVAYPFTAFNFAVEIRPAGGAEPLVGAAFSDCDGLEMSHEVKTLRQGGDNARVIRLGGVVQYGQLTLKRGMTENFDLWRWFSRAHEPGGARERAEVTVVLLAADGRTENARFVLHNCLPVKLKAPLLNAKEGGVAVEELQLVYESLRHESPQGGA